MNVGRCAALDLMGLCWLWQSPSPGLRAWEEHYFRRRQKESSPLALVPGVTELILLCDACTAMASKPNVSGVCDSPQLGASAHSESMNWSPSKCAPRCRFQGLGRKLVNSTCLDFH